MIPINHGAIDVHVHIIPPQLLHSDFLQTAESDLKSGGKCYTIWGKRISPVHPALTDVQVHLERMLADRIKYEVISIPPYIFGYEKDADFAKKWSRTYNDALAEICLTHSGKFIALGTLPMQDVSFAVEELRHCLYDLHFPGFELGSQINGEDLDSEKLSPVFEEANKHGCAILIHPFNVPPPPRMESYYTNNLVGNPSETALTATRLLLSGFFGRYPNIRVCLSHGGGSFPYIYSRIKHGFSVRPEPHIAHIASVEIPPNMYADSIVYEEINYQFLSQVMGPTQICMGSDYPFDMQLTSPVNKLESWCLTRQELQLALRKNSNMWLFGGCK